MRDSTYPLANMALNIHSFHKQFLYLRRGFLLEPGTKHLILGLLTTVPSTHEYTSDSGGAQLLSFHIT